MALTKTEVNLRRLLAAAPQQQNQAKLIHCVVTLREKLEQLGEERSQDGLPRISKAKLNDYSEKIEVIASKLAASFSSDVQEFQESTFDGISIKESSKLEDEAQIPTSPGLRRRHAPLSSAEDRNQDTTSFDSPVPVKLDNAAQTHIEKHRKLQEDLTDEMVGLAQQLKESSLMMNESLKNTEKLLDSTEKAVEHSLATTGHASKRTMEISSTSLKTMCFTWLLVFLMICIFVMVVLLIRVT